jgi:hypothetical protein
MKWTYLLIFQDPYERVCITGWSSPLHVYKLGRHVLRYRYTSLYRNRPVKPQNEGLEGLDEVKALRREKPQYVVIQRDR